MDLDQVIKIIPGLGVSGVLIVLVYGIMKGWLVTGREHTAVLLQLTNMQLQLSSMAAEMQKLRDRDESQQLRIDELGKQNDALRNENLTLKQQVGEMQFQIKQAK